jgi:predicted outer membrane repeat protein
LFGVAIGVLGFLAAQGAFAQPAGVCEPVSSRTICRVTNVSDLVIAFAEAEATAGWVDIRLDPGVYAVNTLSAPLTISRGNVRLIGSGSYIGADEDLDATLTEPNPATDLSGAASYVLDGGNGVRVIDVIGMGGTLYVQGVTIRNGVGPGGAIRVQGATFKLVHSILEGNSRSAVLLSSFPDAQVFQSEFRNNLVGSCSGNPNPSSSVSVSGAAGGLTTVGTGELLVDRSTFAGNAGCEGGGMQVNHGDVRITRSTFSGNQASGRGGAIFFVDAPLFPEVFNLQTSFIFNTVYNNTASQGGGLAFNAWQPSFDFMGNIVAGNAATGATTGQDCLMQNQDPGWDDQTLIDPSSGVPIEGPFLRFWDNVIGRADTCATFFGSPDGVRIGSQASPVTLVVGVDVGALAANPVDVGLVVRTHAPITTGRLAAEMFCGGGAAACASLGIRGNTPVACPTPDQRGNPVPGADCTHGAVEQRCQQELVSNQGFEAGTSGWAGSFGTTISSSTALARSGTRSLRIENRNLGTWQGAQYSLLGLASPGQSLSARAFARIVGDPSEPVMLTSRAVCSGNPNPIYQQIAAATATNTSWVELAGAVAVPSCTLTEHIVYVEGPRTTVIVHLDDVSIGRETVCALASGGVSAAFVTTNDWGAGYCVNLVVTNGNTAPTTNWSVTLNTNGTQIYNIWNLTATGASGQIVATPTAQWSRVIAPGASSHSLGFCANRPGGGTALPTVVGASGQF